MEGNITVTLTPIYEEKNFIEYADRELSDRLGNVNAKAFDCLIDELLNGFSLNFNFMTPKQGDNLKKHIGTAYFNNASLVKMINRAIARGWGNDLHILILILKQILGISQIEVDLSTKAGFRFFRWYMWERCQQREEMILKDELNHFFMQDCIIMWGITLIKKNNTEDRGNTYLMPGEKAIIDTKNPEFIEFAMKKGFLDYKSVYRYVVYSLDMDRADYNVLVPLLMKNEEM